MVKRRFKRGEALVEQGQKSNALYILLTGRARVMTSDSRGREVILATLDQGDYLGEMSIIDNEPHSATVRAEVQTALQGGVPLPDAVTLYGTKSAALSAYIVQELGIAEENQLWIEPK